MTSKLPDLRSESVLSSTANQIEAGCSHSDLNTNGDHDILSHL
jgi:hypothetical protein